MLTVENVDKFEVLTNTVDVFCFNKKVWGIESINADWYILLLDTEYVYARKDKKLKIVNHPFKNDSQWS